MKNKDRFHIGIILVLLLTLFLVGCQSQPSQDGGETQDPDPRARPDNSKVLKSEIPRETAPKISAAQMAELVAGNRGFAVDFYQAVKDRDGNIFYSPYSLSVALAMTYGGARGSTEEQMAETMHYLLPQAGLHEAFNALDLDLSTRADGPGRDDEPQPFRLNIANSLWGQYDYSFLGEFLDLQARHYGAGLRLVDFAGEPEPTRQEINRWVEDRTEDKIKDLIPEGEINDLTRLVLANAIYFKADWLEPFEKEYTRELPFNKLDGAQVNVPMMAYTDPVDLLYLDGDGYQAVELPYAGGQVAMLIVVPDDGNFESFEVGLDATVLDDIQNGLMPFSVSLNLPQFSFESEYKLAKTLKAMGMPDAFDEKVADFSGMDGSHDLFIGNVFHKAFVAVDEKGTEAAAASAVVMKLESMVMSDVQLLVDRPFIFMIMDKPSGTILFLGRVLNPLQ